MDAISAGNMIYGVLSLMGVQFLAAIAGLAIYSRQKSALDIEKRDRGSFGVDVAKALSAANDALAGVTRIDVEQYRDLARKYAHVVEELETLKVKYRSLEESLAHVNQKLASREKYEKRAAQNEPRWVAQELPATPPAPHAPAPAPGTFEIPPGVDPIEFMKQMGVAQPLAPQMGFQQQVLPLEGNTFGKVATGR